MSLVHQLPNFIASKTGPVTTERTCAALLELEAGGEIRNPVFGDIKSGLGARYWDWRSENHASLGGLPYELRHLPGFLRKNPERRTAGADFWSSVAELIEASKARVVKGRRPPSNNPSKPAFPHVSVPLAVKEQLARELTTIIDEVIGEFEAHMRTVNRNEARRVWSLLERKKINDRIMLHSDRSLLVSVNAMWRSVFFGVRGERVAVFPEGEVVEKANCAAAETALFVRDHFVLKNQDKVAPLLALKNLVEVQRPRATVRNGAVHSFMTFMFDDGSRFGVRNKIVYCSGSDTQGPYVQYPTTFHDVVVAGEPMKQPSEAKIRKAFCS